MPGQPIPSELREKGLIWLLPPYCWSHRQIARKLKISASVVSKWRCELVEQGLLPENEKITSVDVEDWTPERRFSVVLETATLSEMEIADYCRRMGLFVEQVKEWRAISIQAHEKKLTEIFEQTGHCVTQKISYESWRKSLSAKIKLWRKLRPCLY